MRRALLMVIALAAACSPRGAPKPSNEISVVVISIDTLRADRLPMYGYGAVATPNLDALRRESILYRNAYSHCPLTLPSHATIFTGQLPADNGVRDNIGYELPETAATLAETLRANGYATGGAVSAYVLRKKTGIAQGFDFWEDEIELRGANLTVGRIQRDGAETVEIAKRWIGAQTKPFFFFLHLYEPHTPYAPPEPFKSRYASPYDGEVAYTDDLVGRVVTFLKEKDLWDDALVIVLSDHGEGLGDHGEDEHGIFLYREAIHVPLLVKVPGGGLAGKSVDTPVQLADVFATVAAQTGTKGGAPWKETKSLIALAQEGTASRAVYSETYYPRFHFGWNDLHSITDGTWHYIRSPKPELFDTQRDPGERQNVLEANRRRYFALQKALDPFVRRAAAPAAVDAEDAAKLAALGYVGSTVESDPDEVLPDPKDKIGSFREMQRAFALIKNNQLREGLALTERILADNPRMLDVWGLKSRALASLGRESEAIEAAKEGLRLNPNAAHLAIEIGNLSLRTGDLEQAEKHAELVVEREPSAAHEILARVWIARKDLDRAEAEARKALQADDDRVTALLAMARVESERKNYEKALVYLDEAVASLDQKGNRAVTNVHFLRGDVLARLGRVEEAERELRKEIEYFPEAPLAYRNLILLLVAQGRVDEATRLVFRLAEASPTPPAYQAIVDTLKAVGDEQGARYWARKAREKYPEMRG
ncbi:MAG TPA: sulfatase-like hydrolase/transferase [Thermoanaerobaculia bacterium]